MKILLLGGLGYIGSTLSQYVLDQCDDKITIVDTLEFGVDPIYFYKLLNNDRVRFIKDDISNLRTTYELIKKHDVVVDLASLTLPNSAKEPGDASFVNQTMAEILGDICRKLGKHMIFMSTCSNYGKATKLVDESGELLPVSIYAISKVNTEKYLLKNVPNATVLRCATAFGVGAGRTRWDVLLNDFVKTALVKQEIDVFQPNAHRPICHVSDISKAIHLMAQKRPSGVYNVGSSEMNYTKGQLADIVGKITEAKITTVDKEDKRDYKVDFGKIKKEFGYEPQITPEIAIPSLIEQYAIETGQYQGMSGN